MTYQIHKQKTLLALLLGSLMLSPSTLSLALDLKGMVGDALKKELGQPETAPAPEATATTENTKPTTPAFNWKTPVLLKKLH